MPKTIPVKGLFDDGNAIMILAKCRKPARKAGWTDEQLSAFSKEAKSKNFDHLLQTVMKHFHDASEDDNE